MAVTQMIPYLFFNGEGADAVSHYQKALGADVLDLRRYSEMPTDPDAPDVDPNRLMHAMLSIDGQLLMISDTQDDQDHSRSPQVELNLNFDDLDDQQRRFEALAEGGEVTAALHDAFWGDRFGAVTDRFGIRWMLTCPSPKAE